MRFLLDENVDTQLPLLRSYLEEKGHNVVAQSEIAPGIPDIDVLAFASQEGRTIISFDEDFSIYRFRDNFPMPFGVILLKECKDKVNPDDALMTRKIANAIESIVTTAKNNGDVLCDTIFRLTQPTPYVNAIIQPKRYKDKKEVLSHIAYFEEQLYASSELTWKSISVEAETLVNG